MRSKGLGWAYAIRLTTEGGSAKRSRQRTFTRFCNPKAFLVASIALTASLCLSTRSALRAPLERASKLRAPVPANRSSTSAPPNPLLVSNAEARPSRTRSDVGRVVWPTGPLNRLPFSDPLIILIVDAKTVL